MGNLTNFILLIVWILCFVYFVEGTFFEEKGTQPIKLPKDTIKQVKGYETVDTHVVGDCEYISNMEKRQDCYFHYAITDKNLSACDKITLGLTRDKCLTETVMTVCGGADRDYMYKCYSNLAEKHKKPEICFRIDDTRKQQYCLYTASCSEEDINACKKYEKENPENQKIKDACYINVALNTGNKKICEQIGNDSIRSECKMYAESLN